MKNILYRIKRKILKIFWSQEKYYSWEENEVFMKNVVEVHYPIINGKNRSNSPLIVSVFNGFERHGGLADRFRGIISAYKYAKGHELSFAIYWEEPFILQDYLVPNSYNWTISKGQLIYSRPSSIPIHIGSFYKRHGIDKRQEEFFQMKTLDDAVKINSTSSQIHLYSNAHFGDDDYYNLFHELFKPSLHLQKLIDANLQNLGKEYVAASFRFMQLLGDFKDECKGGVLNNTEKNIYIQDCVRALEKLHSMHTSCKFLVTSDSETFLNEVIHHPYVYIVPGKISHTDSKGDTNLHTYDKEFLDLLLLSKAKIVYRIHKGKMYYSGFPLTAGMIGGIEVETVEI